MRTNVNKRDMVVWNSLEVNSIIVSQLRFEEFVCKIFYVTVIDHLKKLIVKNSGNIPATQLAKSNEK